MKLPVLLEGAPERDDAYTTPEPVTVIAHHRLVIHREPEFGDWVKSEELAVQKARRDRVAAGEGLHAALVQPRPVVRLGRGDEPPPDERRQVVRNSRPIAKFDRGKRHI